MVAATIQISVKSPDRCLKENHTTHRVNSDVLFTALGQKFSALPEVARLREVIGCEFRMSPDDVCAVERIFDDLYSQYTMVSGREVHLKFSQRVGFVQKWMTGEPRQDQNSADDVLFF
ncbi:MAG: hypothetical protein ACRC9K_19310 [Afipia sp.]